MSNAIQMSPPPQAVREQLSRILASDAFQRSPRMCRFLQYVIEETLAGRAGQLGEFGIGMAVFERGVDFEPAVDPIVRNDARRLRFKLLEYYGVNPTAPILIEIPKGGYVPVFQVMQPERDGRSSHNPGVRIAVLPLNVAGDSSDTVIYARAMRTSITAALTGLRGVETVSNEFVKDLQTPSAAASFGLSHVISGMVVGVGSCCRFTLSVTSVESGLQLWAGVFDIERGDRWFAFETEIATAVREQVVSQTQTVATPAHRLAIAA